MRKQLKFVVSIDTLGHPDYETDSFHDCVPWIEKQDWYECYGFPSWISLTTDDYSLESINMNTIPYSPKDTLADIILRGLIEIISAGILQGYSIEF